jgi:hypothetical protein
VRPSPTCAHKKWLHSVCVEVWLGGTDVRLTPSQQGTRWRLEISTHVVVAVWAVEDVCLWVCGCL